MAYGMQSMLVFVHSPFNTPYLFWYPLTAIKVDFNIPVSHSTASWQFSYLDGLASFRDASYTGTLLAHPPLSFFQFSKLSATLPPSPFFPFTPELLCSVSTADECKYLSASARYLLSARLDSFSNSKNHDYQHLL